jgi:hypothetical protein
MNVCGVVITTNHKADGIYLPADDRRHYVAWSTLTKEDFATDYWQTLYRWYDDGGSRDVAAYLATLNLSGFDPKAPPPKTPAFWDIVDASRAPEDAELADLLDVLGNPNALTLAMLDMKSDDQFREWLQDRRNRRQIPHRLESVGYSPCATRPPTMVYGRSGPNVKQFTRAISCQSAIASPQPRTFVGNPGSEVSQVSDPPLSSPRAHALPSEH